MMIQNGGTSHSCWAVYCLLPSFTRGGLFIIRLCEFGLPIDNSFEPELVQLQDVDALLMMMTLSGQRSIQHASQAGEEAPVRTGPARVKDAGSASGTFGPLTRPRKPFECPLAQRVISGGKTHVCQLRERKNCSLNAHIFWFNRVPLAPHVP